jgi:hypothetical protein
MASSIHVPRSHLILAICLPLAVLLGYFLAEPLESASLAVVLVIAAFLAVPILLKWHHPLLIFSWNATMILDFVPGHPPLWIVMTAAAIVFALLHRSVSKEKTFQVHVEALKPLILLSAIIMLTALATGGFGFRSFGGERYGGKAYTYLFASIIGFFVIASQRVPASRVPLYLAIFFLPALTSLVGNIAYAGGPAFYFLFHFFPSDVASEQITGDYSFSRGMVRLYGLSAASVGVFYYFLSRYGIRGCLDVRKPIRLLLFIAILVSAVFSGFRAVFILLAVTFAIQFFLEGMHRTRWLPAFIGAGLLVTALMIPFVDKLPLVVQRTMSFLPLARVNAEVKEMASVSTEWRVEMWKALLPKIPEYFWKGKGYSLTPQEVYLAEHAAELHLGETYEASMVTGEYHSGPFTVFIPFGIYGTIAFIWFMYVAIKVLWRSFKFGEAQLKSANTLLLSAFLAKLVIFVFIFGSFHHEFFFFTGILGLSICFNGVLKEPEEEALALETLEAVPIIASGRDSA